MFPDILISYFHQPKADSPPIMGTGWEITAAKPISIADVGGSELAYVNDEQRVEDYYKRLHSTPLNIAEAFNKAKGIRDYWLIGPRLTGFELNSLFLFIASDKSYGLDTEDLVMDWRDLFSDPYNLKRLKAHRRMNNWNLLEPDFERWRQLIGQDLIEKSEWKDFSLHGQPREVRPLARWRVNPDGSRQWKLRYAQDEREDLRTTKRAVKAALAENGVGNPKTWRTTLGVGLIAAYSPQLFSHWKSPRGYTEDSKGAVNDMGATQAIARILIDADTFLASPILPAFETHVQSSKG